METKGRTVTITCTETQAQLLSMVCDSYSRLICGQLGSSLQDVCEDAWCKRNATEEHPHGIGSKEWYYMREKLEARLKEFQEDYWGLYGGRYNGIHYDNTADDLYTMHQCLRHARYLNMPPKKREKMKYTVMAYEPVIYGEQPLIKVEYKEE